MNAEATRFPLAWPTGWPRTVSHKRQRSNFRTKGAQLSVYAAIQRLSGEVDRLGARNVILSTNMETRLDGLPRAGQSEPRDPGVAVYFSLKKAPRCLACDRWTRTADNVAAIAQHIDALRRIDRYGVGTLDQVFAGYAALPPKADPWEVLGVPRTATRDAINDAHRCLAILNHPDKGGSDEQMARINGARDEALRVMEAMR